MTLTADTPSRQKVYTLPSPPPPSPSPTTPPSPAPAPPPFNVLSSVATTNTLRPITGQTSSSQPRGQTALGPSLPATPSASQARPTDPHLSPETRCSARIPAPRHNPQEETLARPRADAG